jgi:hypothetical protein
MLYRNMIRKYYSEAGEDGADAGGAGATKTYTQEEVDALVSGLKSNTEKLLAEKKDAARKAKEADDARLMAEQERAKKSGELEQFEQSLRKQYDPVIAEKDAKLTALSNRILGSERKAVMGDVLAKGKFIDPDAADLLAQFVKTEFDGDAVVTKFVGADGSVITTDVDKFIDYCKKHKVISHLMQADAASGGGAAGGRGAGGAGKTMKRSDFDSLNPNAKRQFMTTGGTLTE